MPDKMPSAELRCCRLLNFTGEPQARRRLRVASCTALPLKATQVVNGPVKPLSARRARMGKRGADIWCMREARAPISLLLLAQHLRGRASSICSREADPTRGIYATLQRLGCARH